MVEHTKKYKKKILIGFLIITIPCILLAFPDIEGSDNRRLLIAVDLFPSFLASDKNIHNKIDIDDKLHVVIAYQYDQQTAEDMAQRLKNLGKIRGIPLTVKSLTVNDIEHSNNEKIAGIFISESMIPLKPIINKSIVNQFIVFSPFEGDVEKGATGGLYINEKILPYININTMNLAKINMKSFFLRVSKKYE
jgi:sulfite reductase alpha subunit-like flavoprotein